MEPEVHIAGLLVQIQPEHRRRVAKAVGELPGAEVRNVGKPGRLVVVCECAGGDELMALVGRIRDLPGVLNVALVYQHVESAAAMEEEVSIDEADTPGIH
jgi:nitrate reductase NapD